MQEKTIVLLGFDFEQSLLNRVQKECDCPEPVFFSSAALKRKEEREKVLDFIGTMAAAVLAKDLSWEADLKDFYLRMKKENPGLPIIPVGSEMIKTGLFKGYGECVERVNRYFIYGGRENYAGCLRYITGKFLGNGAEPEVTLPVPVAFDGIFHPAFKGVFDTLDTYLRMYEQYLDKYKYGTKHLKGWIGILIHRSSWISGNLSVESLLIEKMEEKGLGVIPVFSYGSVEPELKNRDFDSIVNSCFSKAGRLWIDGIVNLQVLPQRRGSLMVNVFEQAAKTFEELDIPVFRPLISFMRSRKDWEESMDGLSLEMPWSFITPEMQGMIEPVIIGCRDERGLSSTVPDRIERFASRAAGWLNLRRKPSEKKKLAIIIHNSPCSGVEATVGMGVGLDVFASVVSILERLKREGWKVEGIPENAEALKEMVMERKAYSDFRWTSVEDIVESGGCLYKMPIEGENGYGRIYKKLDEKCRDKMEEIWGMPPGEGMVLDGHIIISGLDLGNVILMVQPKRGCYGAKCTGEVCKILQDPECPPPHQFIAAYRYIEEIYKADACLHVGTHGSLEFLPGKANAMSSRCFPDIAIGNLPNLYIYNTGIGTEAMVARRRAYSALVGHLPQIRKAGDGSFIHLARLIGDYFEASSQGLSQAEYIRKQIDEKIEESPEAIELMNRNTSFGEGLNEIRSIAVRSLKNAMSYADHVFGRTPPLQDAARYIKEVLLSDEETAEKLENIWDDPLDMDEGLGKYIAAMIPEKAGENRIVPDTDMEGIKETDRSLHGLLAGVAADVRELYRKLAMTSMEMENLIKALNGGYIPPGPSGMPDENGRNILPAGRNLYTGDIEKVPTRAAYEAGRILAEELVRAYMGENGKYPEKVAMNMISTDISRTKGEQLSQILCLMGISPVWDANGRVTGLEHIPLKQLERPRIDVTVRISGVLRDSFPEAVEMIDSAVMLAAELPEPESQNFVKKHTIEIADTLLKLGITDELERRSTIRIFGDRPGTYGAGVDLALKASAWKNEDDLARYFIYFSSHAYGKSLHGRQARHEFVENVKNAEISYDVDNSGRYDMLASGFSASVQGGFGLVRKIFSGKEIKQYRGFAGNRDEASVGTLEDKLKEAIEDTFFSPVWKKHMKEQGYKGAAGLMERLQNIFEWQCLTQKVEAASLDRLAEEYILDPVMMEWFRRNNCHALEEIARRFLELVQRDRWNADAGVLERLKTMYLDIEGDMEERTDGSKGEVQGGSIEIISDSDVKEWKSRLKEVDNLFPQK